MKVNLRKKQFITAFLWDGKDSTIKEIEKELSVFDDFSIDRKGEDLWISIWNGYSGTSIGVKKSNYLILDTTKLSILVEYTEEQLLREYEII